MPSRDKKWTPSSWNPLLGVNICMLIHTHIYKEREIDWPVSVALEAKVKKNKSYHYGQNVSRVKQKWH